VKKYFVSIFLVNIFIVFAIAIFHTIRYDHMEDPSNAGTVICQPIESEATYCSQNDEDVRCHNGRFRYLVKHNGEGIVFYNQERRRIQLNNVSCRVEYGLPR